MSAAAWPSQPARSPQAFFRVSKYTVACHKQSFSHNGWHMLLVRFGIAIAAVALPATGLYATTSAADVTFGETVLEIAPFENTAVYYILEESGAPPGFDETDMRLGSEGGQFSWLFSYRAPEYGQHWFWRLRLVSVFAPQDTDRDRIDDLYELMNPDILDPLDSNDADEDPDLNGKTHLDEYFELFGIPFEPPQMVSREVSLFNYGQANFNVEVIGRELGVYNLGSPLYGAEAISRSVSVFHGEHFPIAGHPVLASREVSLFNLGEPIAAVVAYSREVTVYEGQQFPVAGFPVVHSREVSLFNLGVAPAAVEAISRELTILNEPLE